MILTRPSPRYGPIAPSLRVSACPLLARRLSRRHRWYVSRSERDRGEFDKRCVDDTEHGHLWHRLALRHRDLRNDDHQLDDGCR